MVAAAVRTIFAQPDAAAVFDQLDTIADKLGRQVPAVASMLHDAGPETCAFAAFPQAHWRKIWSNNPVRHEALCDRVEVKGLHRWAVAAA
jgi:putative transposase